MLTPLGGYEVQVQDGSGAGGHSVAALPHGCAAALHGVFLSSISAQKQESPRGLPSVSASSPEISSRLPYAAGT